METPWKSHIDSMAKTLVKSKTRVRTQPIHIELRVETVDSKDKLKNSTTSQNKLAKTGLKPLKSDVSETKKNSV